MILVFFFHESMILWLVFYSVLERKILESQLKFRKCNSIMIPDERRITAMKALSWIVNVKPLLVLGEEKLHSYRGRM